MMEKEFSLQEQNDLMLRTNYTSGSFEDWLAMVNGIIGSYVNKYACFECGVFDREDLEQHGWELLLKSLDYYDGSKVEFGKYLNWYLHTHFHYTVNSMRAIIKLGSDYRDRVSLVMKLRTQYLREYGEEPECVTLAEISGLTVRQVRECLDLYRVSNGYLSLNSCRGGELHEFIDVIDDGLSEFEEDIIKAYSCEQTAALMDELLTENESEVLKLLYGFYDGVMRSGEEVAAIIGSSSRQNVSNIKHRALRKLRNYLESNPGAAA